MRPPFFSPFLFLTIFLFLLFSVLVLGGVTESARHTGNRFASDPALHHLFLQYKEEINSNRPVLLIERYKKSEP